eukprot:scaffold113936_cov12-Tisochrysis_lutea.AAC.1
MHICDSYMPLSTIGAEPTWGCGESPVLCELGAGAGRRGKGTLKLGALGREEGPEKTGLLLL